MYKTQHQVFLFPLRVFFIFVIGFLIFFLLSRAIGLDCFVVVLGHCFIQMQRGRRILGRGVPPSASKRYSNSAGWHGVEGHERKPRRSWLNKSFWFELGPRRWRDSSGRGRGFEGDYGEDVGYLRGRVKRGLGEASPLLGKGEYTV